MPAPSRPTPASLKNTAFSAGAMRPSGLPRNIAACEPVTAIDPASASSSIGAASRQITFGSPGRSSIV